MGWADSGQQLPHVPSWDGDTGAGRATSTCSSFWVPPNAREAGRSVGATHGWAAPCVHHDTGGQRGHRDPGGSGHPGCTGRATLLTSPVGTTSIISSMSGTAPVAPWRRQHLARGGARLPRRGGDTAAIGPGPALLHQSRIWLRARANGQALQTSSNRPPAPAKSVRGSRAELWDGDARSGVRSGTGGLQHCPSCPGNSYPLGGHRPSARSQPAGQEEGRARAAPGMDDKAPRRTSRQDGALPHRGHGAPSIPFWVPQCHPSH